MPSVLRPQTGLDPSLTFDESKVCGEDADDEDRATSDMSGPIDMCTLDSHGRSVSHDGEDEDADGEFSEASMLGSPRHLPDSLVPTEPRTEQELRDASGSCGTLQRQSHEQQSLPVPCRSFAIGCAGDAVYIWSETNRAWMPGFIDAIALPTNQELVPGVVFPMWKLEGIPLFRACGSAFYLWMCRQW